MAKFLSNALFKGTLTADGAVTLSTAAGVGTRMLVANASGVLSTAAIPTEVDTLATVTARGNVSTGNVAINGKLTIGSNDVGAGQRIDASPGPGNFDFINSSGGGFFFRWIQNGGTAMQLTTNNNLLLSTTVDTGLYRLDVNGAGRFQGSLNVNHTAANIAALDVRASTRDITLYVDNTRGTGTNYAGIFQASGTAANIAGYFNATYGTSNIALKADYGDVILNASGGSTKVGSLSGTGTRMVVADTAGILTTQIIPTTSLQGAVDADKSVSGSLVIGSTTVKTVSASTYSGVFFDYVVKKGTNVRVGSVVAITNGTTVEFYETLSNDIGVTSDLTFNVTLNSGIINLNAVATSTGFSVIVSTRAI